MPKPPPDWLNQSDPPTAVVERQGRWSYRVYISHGIMQWGPDGYGWIVLGRRRAARKAARVLRKYLLREQRQSDRFAVPASAVSVQHLAAEFDLPLPGGDLNPGGGPDA